MFPLINKRETGVNLRRIMDMRGNRTPIASDIIVKPMDSRESRLRGMGAYGADADFEGRLQKKFANEYSERVQLCDKKNSQLQSTAEEMRLSILGKDSKTKDESKHL